MISAFIIFSGVAALNCSGTNLAALESFSSICWVLRAVPIKKSFLYASLNVGVVVDVVAFLLLLQEIIVTVIATTLNLNKNFLFISVIYLFDSSCFRWAEITWFYIAKIQNDFLQHNSWIHHPVFHNVLAGLRNSMLTCLDNNTFSNPFVPYTCSCISVFFIYTDNLWCFIIY